MSRKKKQQAEPEAESAPAAAGTGAGFADAPPPAPSPNRITPIDIQQKVFRSSVRGYHEREVDQFLDDVTEELARLLAETRSLREQLERAEMRPTARFGADAEGAAELEDARVQAARALAEAREEAARVVAEARGEAVVILEAASAEAARPGASAAAVSGVAAGAAVETAGGRAPDRDFIHRERGFLQAMASLIQDHAEAIRDDLRRVRGEPPLEPDQSGDEPEPPADAASAAAVTGAAAAGAESMDADRDEGGSAEAPPAPAVEGPLGAGSSGDDAGASVLIDAPSAGAATDADVEPEAAQDDVIDLADAGAHEDSPSDEAEGADGSTQIAAAEPEPGAHEDSTPDDAAPPVFATAASASDVVHDDGTAHAEHGEGEADSAEPAWFERPEPRDDAGDVAGEGEAPPPWDESNAAKPTVLADGGSDDVNRSDGGHGMPDAGTPMASSGSGSEGAMERSEDAGTHPAAVGATLRQASDAAQAERENGAHASGGPPPGWVTEPKPERAAAGDDEDDDPGGRSLRELFWGED